MGGQQLVYSWCDGREIVGTELLAGCVEGIRESVVGRFPLTVCDPRPVCSIRFTPFERLHDILLHNPLHPSSAVKCSLCLEAV